MVIPIVIATLLLATGIGLLLPTAPAAATPLSSISTSSTSPNTVVTAPATAIPSSGVSSAPGWTNISGGAGGPSPRADSGIAYDSADGYVVLFGGQVDSNANSSIPNQHTTCTGDTWTFQDGKWTNLSIPGPPPSCYPAMTYDASDGYVLETGGWTWNGTCECQLALNQTWTFVHGHWSEVLTYSPSGAGLGEMSYDPGTGSVLLFTTARTSGGSQFGEEWSYSDGAWSQLSGSSVPNLNSSEIVGLTYAASDHGLLAYNNTLSGTSVSAWLLRNGSWRAENSPPGVVVVGPALAFDPVLNDSVLFGATVPWNAQNSPPQNDTWLFRGDQWWNASVVGPRYRLYPDLVFDAHDGFLLMFGGWAGLTPVNNVGAALLRETWIFGPHPVTFRLGLSASPSPICSRVTKDCGAGTVTTRATLTLAAPSGNPSAPIGLDSGNGTVLWGSYYWTDNPTLIFVGWNNLVPESGAALDATANCTIAGGAAALCSQLPAVEPLPSGNSALRWSWGLPATNNTLLVGDTWTVSFNEVAVGPPFGPDPIDSCATGLCATDGVGPIQGLTTGLSFSPYGNSTVDAVSAPLARVTVLASPSPPNTIPGNSLPSPPPPLGAPLPVGAPAAPLPVPSPVAGTVATTLTSAAGSLSLAAIAGGLVGAGVARGAVRSSPQRVAQPMRVGGRKIGPPPSRGVD